MKINRILNLSTSALLCMVSLRAVASVEVRYWFDSRMQDEHIAYGTELTLEVDVSHLPAGYHYLNAVSVDGEGNLSSPKRSLFLKAYPSVDNSPLTVKTKIDGQEYDTREITSSNGVLEYTLDVNGIPVGIHQLTTEVYGYDGSFAEMYTKLFYKVASHGDLSKMQCLYVVDGKEDNMQSGTYANGMFHFDLDMASLAPGLHTISYLLVSADGFASEAKTAWFNMTPLGGNKICGYEYWINDDFTHSTHVNMDAVQDYNYVELIEVEDKPLRSSNFHFEHVNGKPTIFPVNEFHVRFYDRADRITERSQTYVDYRSPVVVDDIKELSVNQTTLKLNQIPENEIRWFKTSMSIGDSIAVRFDRGVMLDVFSPSGVRVYTAQGLAATTFSGFRSHEEGEYLLAVHDLSGGYAPTLSYQLIDKYAVLSHTPEKTAMTKGLFSVNLFGNGYDKLMSAVLRHGDSEIEAENIVSARYSDATLWFNVKEELPTGAYDLVLKFRGETSDETLLCKNFLELEEAVQGEIKVSVIPSNSSILPYSVKLRVENTGNVPVQLLPVHFGFSGVDDIRNLIFKNFGFGYSREQLERGIDVGIFTDNLFGSGEKGYYLPLMLPELGAYEKIELEFGFDTDYFKKFKIHAWAGAPWVKTGRESESRSINQKACAPGLGSMRDLAGNTANISTAGGLAIGSSLVALSAIGNRLTLAGNPGILDPDTEQALRNGGMRYNPVAPGHILGVATGAFEIGDVMGSCENDATAPSENDATDISVPGPCDPNDITGYTAKSGSHYVGIGVDNLEYTIEFENEPEIANASAHSVKLSDRLNINVFDVASVYTSKVVIGNREFPIDREGDFVTTVDLRPAINALAEVSLTVNKQSGELEYQFVSLNPLTLLPTFDVMEGLLPVNNGNGDGEGCVVFNVKLLPQLADGTEIENHAEITFDFAQPILTPVWSNITDYVRPSGKAVSARMRTNNSAVVRVEKSDTGSGIWRQRLYGRVVGEIEMTLLAEADGESELIFPVSLDHSYELCVVVIDLAGNEEQKTLAPECLFKPYIIGDANTDSKVDSQDATIVTKFYLTKDDSAIDMNASDVNGDYKVDSQDNVGITRIYTDSGKINVQPKRRIKRK